MFEEFEGKEAVGEEKNIKSKHSITHQSFEVSGR